MGEVQDDPVSQLERGPAVWFIPPTTTEAIDAAASWWRSHNWSVKVIRGSRLSTPARFYGELTAAYQFPLSIHWDPVVLRETLECFRILPYEVGHILVIVEADQMLSRVEKQYWRRSIIESLVDARRSWDLPVPDLPFADGRPAVPFNILLMGSDPEVFDEWTAADAKIRRVDGLPVSEATRQFSSLDELPDQNDIGGRLFIKLAATGGFNALSGALWKSREDLALMTVLPPPDAVGARVPSLGIWFPSLADGGLPGSWRDCHLLAELDVLDPNSRFELQRIFSVNTSLADSEIVHNVNAVFRDLILPIFDGITGIDDLLAGGRSRSLLEKFRVTAEALTLLNYSG